jgi:hypothetical protein
MMRAELHVGLAWLLVSFTVPLAACSKSESESSAAPAPATSPRSALAASASAAVTAAPVDAGPKNTTYEGTYAATPGTLSRMPDSPKWSGDEADAGLGPGTLSFTIDGATGRIAGKAEGALGDLILAGQLGDEGVVTFTLLRASPADGGFTGVGRGVRTAAGGIEGTLHVSTALGSVLREGTFTVGAPK